MLRFVSVFVLIAAVAAYGGKGAGRASAGGYGGARGGGYGGGAGVAVGGGFVGNAGGAGQIVPAAIQTRHSVEFRDVPSTGSVNPTVVEVGASSLPVTILFRSASSSLNVQQAHDGAQGSVQESSSEDEAHVLKHAVNKPIVQEVREVITPFRRITQEVQPVQEQINTIVARNVGTYAQKAAPAATYVQQAAPAQTKVLSSTPALREAAAY